MILCSLLALPRWVTMPYLKLGLTPFRDVLNVAESALPSSVGKQNPWTTRFGWLMFSMGKGQRWRIKFIKSLQCCEIISLQLIKINLKKRVYRGFPSCPVVKNPTSNVGHSGLIPDQRTEIPHAMGHATREVHALQQWPSAAQIKSVSWHCEERFVHIGSSVLHSGPVR